MNVFVILAALGVSAAAPAFAATPATTTGAADTADAQISANVMAANTAEIEAGKLAEQKAMNAQVKAFAKHMVEDHSANNKQASTLDKEINVKPEENTNSKQMSADAQSKIDALKSKTGAEFDKAYIDLQVQMHQQVLDAINNKLTPMAMNPSMKSFLSTTKTHVEQHLAMAKKIQSTLK